MRPRSQSEYEHARLGIAETRHRKSPVLLVSQRRSLLAPDLLSISNQARAEPAIHNFTVQDRERGGHSRHCNVSLAERLPSALDCLVLLATWRAALTVWKW